MTTRFLAVEGLRLRTAEALPGAALQPRALLVPVLAVALVAVTANLAADSAGHRSRRVLA